jgi:hypothetical protein
MIGKMNDLGTEVLLASENDLRFRCPFENDENTFALARRNKSQRHRWNQNRVSV